MTTFSKGWSFHYWEILLWYFNSPEFLKAAIMQSHDCTKYFRICANFGLRNAKQEEMSMSQSCLVSHVFLCDFQCMFLRKMFNKHILIVQKNSRLESQFKTKLTHC